MLKSIHRICLFVNLGCVCHLLYWLFEISGLLLISLYLSISSCNL
jgi:hypothetical protein